jgi:alkanesulfonate monooxygenase SsuD/methylene tetrahydromethanopterin reductase-like flavin-dependent oxidoreductase (luciferase family)
VKYGFVLPGGSAQVQLEQAVLAEQAGWDGVFVWEAAYGVDAWTLLAAIAARTGRVKLGTMLTPLPWRRPWKVASQVVTLDQISNGRAILAVGLGAIDNFLGNTGEELDRKTRAAMMDEGIDLIRGLWEGIRVYTGQHYQMDLSGRVDLSQVAQPVQERIPIWCVAAWPSEKSMTRILRCDGILPNVMKNGEHTPAGPDDIREILAWLRERGGGGESFDFIMEGETTNAGDTAAIVPLAEAGATWWLETRWGSFDDPDKVQEAVRERIIAGPPRI